MAGVECKSCQGWSVSTSGVECKVYQVAKCKVCQGVECKVWLGWSVMYGKG